MSSPDDHDLKPAEVAGRAMAIVFGIAFGGIGLAVMGFQWAGGDGFGEPPTFFKIFGTLVALPFVGFGVVALLGGLGVTRLGLKSPSQSLAEQMKEMQHELGNERTGATEAKATNYTCPHCSAPLGSSGDASPHGDVKCTHCGAWFNIYGK